MKFDVWGVKSIIDPDSKKQLGKYRYKKIGVKVQSTDEHYSIASTEIHETFPSSWLSTSSEIFGTKTYRDMVSADVTVDRKVYVGDSVVQVPD